MARFNKIFAGPVTDNDPQVQEAICATAIMPGTGLVWSGANFAQAGASAVGKLFIAQDNYLLMKGVDDTWDAGDRVIGMEFADDEFFNVRVPTATNVAKGAALTTNATGRFILATAGKMVFAFTEEAYNNTSGSDQLVRVRAAKGYISA
ncbi:hypothetical protein [Phyllobacterium calauticae]|jgi:hypothetical protein|uniref:hypothetical protein n=1 Tax=Phyllobacterium calauticae TaxID=2817027 RepID=UPI001CBB4921|nr:hypothetical protein [Phyllobacterium calauticae]MBZ3690996.1 hypothetical protein [Phyllobacterium calauticae]